MKKRAPLSPLLVLLFPRRTAMTSNNFGTSFLATWEEAAGHGEYTPMVSEASQRTCLLLILNSAGSPLGVAVSRSILKVLASGRSPQTRL